MCIYIYIYIYIERERERDPDCVLVVPLTLHFFAGRSVPHEAEARLCSVSRVCTMFKYYVFVGSAFSDPPSGDSELIKLNLPDNTIGRLTILYYTIQYHTILH